VCDTVAVVEPGGPVWLAKNSDREPSEVQVVERHAAAAHEPGDAVRCTHLELPQRRHTHEIIISRPRWMWGCEMGVNEHGVAAGNEAVFTRVPVATTGLTGMDLQRLALERAASAREAVDIITGLIARYAQGGGMGFRQRSFRYHSSFMLADSSEAWVLETAGPYWVAERVRAGVRSISNALSIGAEFDLIGPGTYELARTRGWCQSAADFDFAGCFASRFYAVVSGGEQRCRRTSSRLGGGAVDIEAIIDTLRDHGGRQPLAGWRSEAPCAHASWLPTRSMAQTTGSMIARLAESGGRYWFTGTSAPCLSVFKPVLMGGDSQAGMPAPRARYDGSSLWWRQARLHRIVVADYDRRSEVFLDDRNRLEQRCIGTPPSAEMCADLWQEHRAVVPRWSDLAARVGRWRPTPSQLYWQSLAIRDAMW
jgi:secernin